MSVKGVMLKNENTICCGIDQLPSQMMLNRSLWLRKHMVPFKEVQNECLNYELMRQRTVQFITISLQLQFKLNSLH